MRLTVIVATYGRKHLIGRLLSHMAQQNRLPQSLILAAPDASHIDVPSDLPFPVSLALGRHGLAAQRNLALEQALPHSDLITFFDDDFLPSKGYLALVARGFETHHDWAMTTGTVILDGVGGPGVTFEDGLALLLRREQMRPTRDPNASDAPVPWLGEITDRHGAYGCNMSARTAMIGDIRFDERLVLYGWQEDTDFSMQMRQRGRIVTVGGMEGVHLGTKAGRVSGVRFGYSQISNPIYLLRKGSMPAWFALQLISRNVVMNVARSMWTEPHIDRRGRLRGNMLAARHVLSGRIEPEYVLSL